MTGLRVRVIARAHVHDGDAIEDFGAFVFALVDQREPEQVLSALRVQQLTGGDVATAIREALPDTLRAAWTTLDIRRHARGGHEFYGAGTDGGLYVPTILLSLAKWIPGIGDAGAIVAVPSYQSVLVRPLTSRKDFDSVTVMADVAQELFETFDHPCDPRVHWWNGRRCVVMDGTGAPGFRPVSPPELVAVASALPLST